MPRQRDPKNWLTRECPQCGDQFETPRYRAATYCSAACYEVWVASRRIETTCPMCGKEFWYHTSWPRKYCSDQCKGRANIANIKGFASSAYVTACQQCGVEFTTTPKRTRGRFCSLKCWGEWMSETGAVAWTNSPNWSGGGEYYYGPNWLRQRRLVLARDAGACVDCGFVPRNASEALHVHHITPFDEFGVERFREANALGNLVSLCNSCHQLRHKREERRAS